MFQAYQAVLVIDQEHPRAGQAGRVVNTNNQAAAGEPEAVQVQFDLDQALVTVPSASLRILGL